jgi:two-component system response regulator GlrR
MSIIETPAAQPAQPSLDQARRDFERDYLVRILGMTQGNVTHAARLAGRNRTEFYRLLERHSLSPGMFKPAPDSPDPFKPRSVP